ncbi:hypothetical protein HYALB_00006579 [Hymenoscyphus albidus]|uniref:AAA+ ATPase domain-containing protein n=1 Tax=Hymenoscyphus albidus TaxID=595503 RepID=A0A9N9QBW2_9HELO|nr:hypothetical protein HYALB_00006579 [Hymenoscyphus albidus]
MGDPPSRKYGLLQDLVLLAVSLGSMWYIAQSIVSSLPTAGDPDKEQHEQARIKAAANLRRLDRRSNDSDSDDDNDGRDIGGLDDIIEELKESVIYPLTMPHLYAHSSSLLAAPSGVLLYGPPGCGKTMLAKALAHESGACFINLHISTLTEKWYGDSNKLVRAVFSLARKLQPTIVFIDEIDSILGQRRSGEHEASGMVKAEFMTLWDGLTSASETGLPSQIMILGATNRIQDIDEAILRRMPKKFPVSLPSKPQRLRILQLLLKDTKIEEDNFDMDYLTRVMAGMSGSDIKESCRDAAMAPIREYIREQRQRGIAMTGVKPDAVRGIRTADFFGTKGGQIIISNHAKVQRDSKKRSTKKSRGQDSSDEYEDTEDNEPLVEPQD